MQSGTSEKITSNKRVAYLRKFAFICASSCALFVTPFSARAADSIFQWDNQTAVNLETANGSGSVDGVTVTTSAVKVGGRTSDTIAIQPTTSSNGVTGIIASSVDANTDTETVSNNITFGFSEPVYNLSFQVRDIDSDNTGSLFTDLITFTSDNGLPSSGVTGTNVTYTIGTGRAISNQITNCQAANAALCVVTVNFTNPVQSVTVEHVSADVIGIAGPTNSTNQAIQIDDLTFNTPPDATNNAASTFVGGTIGGNVITDNDGSGTDSDRQDAPALLTVNQISHPDATSAVGVGGTTLNLANGASLTIAQDGSYTFNTNGAYTGLASGASTTETFTYRIEDDEGLFNTDGDTVRPDSVAQLIVTITNNPIASFDLTKDVDVSDITTPGTLTYTITVDNDGNVPLVSPTLSDSISQGATPLSLTTGPIGPTGDINSDNILDPNETWQYTATYNVTAANIADGANIVNVATFTTTEAGSDSDPATTTTPGPTFACANNDFTDRTVLTGASGFTDCFTTGSDGETGEQSPGNMGALNSVWYEWTAPVGGTVTFDTCDVSQTNYDTYLAVYSASGVPAVNTLTLENSNDDGPGCAAFSSLTSFAVNAGDTYFIQVDGYQGNLGDFRLRWDINNPSMAVTKSVDITEVSNAQTLTYTILVDNDGNADLSSVNLTDTLLQGTDSRTLTSGPTLTSGDDGDGVLEPNETWVYTATYNVTASDIADGRDINNSVDVTTAEITTPITENAITQINAADLELDKVVDNPAPLTGQNVTYTLTLTNNGPDIATGVTVSDNLPAGVSFSGAVPSQGSFTENSGLVEWTPGPVAVGGTPPEIDITVTVNSAAVIPNSAEVTASNLGDPDSTPNDGSGDDFSTVSFTSSTATPNISILKEFQLVKAPGNTVVGLAEVGDTINYTFTVTNTGNQTLTNIDVQDDDTTHSGSGPLPNPANEVLHVDNLPSGDTTDVTSNDGIWSQLGVNDAVRFFTSYTVTQTDIDTQQ